jgi:hypothetical protein
MLSMLRVKIAAKVPAGHPKNAKDREEKNLKKAATDEHGQTRKKAEAKKRGSEEEQKRICVNRRNV